MYVCMYIYILSLYVCIHTTSAMSGAHQPSSQNPPSPMLRSDWDWDRPLLDTTASTATAGWTMEMGKLYEKHMSNIQWRWENTYISLKSWVLKCFWANIYGSTWVVSAESSHHCYFWIPMTNFLVPEKSLGQMHPWKDVLSSKLT